MYIHIYIVLAKWWGAIRASADQPTRTVCDIRASADQPTVSASRLIGWTRSAGRLVGWSTHTRIRQAAWSADRLVGRSGGLFQRSGCYWLAGRRRRVGGGHQSAADLRGAIGWSAGRLKPTDTKLKVGWSAGRRTHEYGKPLRRLIGWSAGRLKPTLRPRLVSGSESAGRSD